MALASRGSSWGPLALVAGSLLLGLYCRHREPPVADPLLDALLAQTDDRALRRAWRAVSRGELTPCDLVARPELALDGVSALSALAHAGWGWKLQDDFEAEPAGADWSEQGERHGGRPGSAPWLTRWHGCDGPCGADPREGVWIADEVGLDGRASRVLKQRPAPPGGPLNTRSSLVEADLMASDFFLSVDRRTDEATREAPNNWETAWVFFRYERGDDLTTDCGGQRSLYLALNRGEGSDAGWEFGRFDPEFAGQDAPGAGAGCQQFLASGDAVRDAGDWSRVCVAAVGSHVGAWIDGTRLQWFGRLTLEEPGSHLPHERGSIALYNEDAEVAFDNVSLFGRP